VGAPGETVVTDNTIGNEISCASRNVKHSNPTAERFDGNDTELCLRLDRNASDTTFATDCRIDLLKEPLLLSQPSEKTNVATAIAAVALNNVREPELAHTLDRSVNNCVVFVGNPQGIAATSLRIEDARKKTSGPITAG
jgi:hypothetical protein